MPQHSQDDSLYLYQRRLPHWQPEGAIVFLTWRLYGSLPQEALQRLEAERLLLLKQPKRSGESPRQMALRHSKRLFALADVLLAQNRLPPQWLAEDCLAQLIVDALFFHHQRLYTLMAYVIMSNHVHVLLRPLEEEVQPGNSGLGESEDAQTGKSAPRSTPLRRITRSLKGYTAREANRILARTGQTFWQDESYDHWVRDEAELRRVLTYIEGDPVRAGLVVNIEDWRWSSAWARQQGRLSWPF